MLCLLIGLFILCLIAPHGWEQVVGRRNAATARPLRDAPALATSGRRQRANPLRRSTIKITPHDIASAVAASIAANWTENLPMADQAALAGPASDVVGETREQGEHLGHDSSAPTLPPAGRSELVSSGTLEFDLPEAAPDPFPAVTTAPEVDWPARGSATNVASAARPTAPPDEPANDAGGAEPSAAAQPSTVSGQRQRWSQPRELRERLLRLQSERQAGQWADNVLALLDQLAEAGGPRGADAGPIVSQLAETLPEVERIALRLDDAGMAEQLRRAGCALERRVAIWKQVDELPGGGAMLAEASSPPPERLLACLTNVDQLTSSSPQGESWRRYLLLERLRDLAQSRQVAREKRRRLAREVLARLTAGQLSQTQRQFATAHPLLALRSELRQWAAEPIDVEQLLAGLERYEECGSAASGELVAGFWRQLRESELTTAQRLAHRIDDQYRGANVRLVISDTLLTRLLPPGDAKDEYVREEILGIPTAGQAHRTTDLAVRLIPDPKRLRFMVEARGLVYAKTSTRSTGATVWAGMNSTYQIQKPFEMTLQGLRTDPTEADAQTRTHLRGIETPLSGVPLLGSMLDGFVRQQYRERRRDAERELRKKVILKAVREMETEVDQRVADANERLRQNVLIPLERLQMNPAVAEMQTTKDRLTLRLRLAADHQLAAHTPRPRAPADSLASLQIHESVLNNVFNQLDLNGRTFSQAELYRWVTGRLNRPANTIPENLRDDVYLTFAPNDSFRVRAKDGQLEINLTLAELRAEGTSYRDFTVRVYYRPDEEGGRGELVRDGVVQLIGKSITLRGQVALRGIFSKTFPRERRFSLLPARFNDDPRLADIRVTQMTLTDGWLGVALAQDRSASAAAHVAR